MKKNLYDYFSYNMCRYAPESFNLVFNDEKVDISFAARSKYNFGYILATKGKEELEKVLKKYIRQDTIFKQKVDSFNLAVFLDDGKKYITISYPVEQYDIDSKLACYKLIKETFKETEGRSPVTVTKAELDGAGNVVKKEDRTETLKLGNRVRLI